MNNAGNSIPLIIYLAQNYPNPFNPTTNISFSLPESQSVKLTVFNILGQAVASEVNETLSAGTYTRTFNGSNLTSGIYFYTLEAGQTMITKKMILIK